MNSQFAETFAMFWERGYSCNKLDRAQTPVAPEQVSRWIRNGLVDGDTHDFLFSGRSPSPAAKNLSERRRLRPVRRGPGKGGAAV